MDQKSLFAFLIDVLESHHLRYGIAGSHASDIDRNELARIIRRPALIGRDAAFVTAEDVILKKMEAYQEGRSEKHLRDITGVLTVLGRGVDRDYIANWANRLGLTEIWDAIIQRLGKT